MLKMPYYELQKRWRSWSEWKEKGEQVFKGERKENACLKTLWMRNTALFISSGWLLFQRWHVGHQNDANKITKCTRCLRSLTEYINHTAATTVNVTFSLCSRVEWSYKTGLVHLKEFCISCEEKLFVLSTFSANAVDCRFFYCWGNDNCFIFCSFLFWLSWSTFKF